MGTGQDQGLSELLKKMPDNQLGRVYEHPEIFKKIESYFQAEGSLALPRVIGLFGGWGSGKTSLIARIVKKMNTKYPQTPVVYFNAWKYSSTTDILPALIYKILTHPLILTQDITSQRIGKMLFSYIKDREFRKPLLELFLTKEKVAAGEKVAGKLKSIGQTIDDSVIGRFLSVTDRNIQILSEALKTSPLSLVIIDELDRCDPDEAYGLIKQLKILFGSQGLPLLFVLSVNPEPIGMAIKNKYGFDQELNDFESVRILEKFVDVKFDIENDVNLYRFFKHHFEINNYASISKMPDTLKQACYLFQKDARLAKENNWWTVLNKEIFQFNNLRIIAKCLESIAIREYFNPNLFWPTLHLDLIKNTHYAFAKKLYRLSKEFQVIAFCCYQMLDAKTGGQENKIKYFDGCFWKCWRAIIDYHEGNNNKIQGKLKQLLTDQINKRDLHTYEDKTQLMKEIVQDFKLMESVKHLTLVRVTEKKNPDLTQQQYIESIFSALGRLISRRV